MVSDMLNSMISSIPNTYDKREGSFIYDALAPVAEQIVKSNDMIAAIKNKMTAQNLSGVELDTRVNDIVGMTRKAATKAVGTVAVTGTGIITIGDLFSTATNIQFASTETKPISGTGNVLVSAIVEGDSGNVSAGTIISFPVTITGFSAVTNLAATTGGTNTEIDDALKERYYLRLKQPSTSGNKAHYIQWALEVSGVGGAKVIPLWNGVNTVKVVIINQNKLITDEALVLSVQNYIDPGKTGLGSGVAPLGAYVTVISATAKTINIGVTLVINSGYTLSIVKKAIEERIKEHLGSIAFYSTYVSYAQIGEVIINTDGVDDYSSFTLNNGIANVTVGNEEVAVLGVVTVA